MKRKFLSLFLVISILMVPVSGTLAQVDVERPDIATPIFAGDLPDTADSPGSDTVTLFAAEVPGLVTNSMQAGGDRLVALQQNDGGWDWPLDDGDPTNASPLNTVGPIAMGLLQSHWHTNDASFVTALQNGGALLLTKTNNFSPSDGYLAASLDALLGGTTYVDHVMANFYTPLASGTYDKSGLGTLYDTAGYVDLVRTSRANSGIGNLAAWDVGMGLFGAAMAGADPTAWIAGTKAEIDELDGAEYYDVIGLTGAIFGLAYVGEDYDPSGGEHEAASNLGDLADILASYQINGGGFAWNSEWVIPNDGNETIQETAYAILALNEVDRAGYFANIKGAADYMVSQQLATGGWENYPTSGENNEITGEALWGNHVALPELWVDQANGDDANEGSFANPMQTVAAALAAADAGTTIHVLAGTYTGGYVLDKQNLIIRGEAGVDVGSGSPAFTVSAADVLIENMVLDGAGDASPAILVQSGGDNLMVRNCEITDWADGIEVAASVTSLKVVSNWIHSNADAGLQINSGVTVGGIVTIEGNLFKENVGDGIYNDSGTTLLAEYNSWGHIDGPEVADGGDGITGVNADPWTYAEFFMDMDPDSLATTVSVGNNETFDLAIKADAVNLLGLSFKITYDPTLLTYNGATFSSPWTDMNCLPVGSPPVGEIHYLCNLISATAWSATAAASTPAGTIATLSFTESDPSSSTAAWPSYIDIDHVESTAGAIGGVKVFLNNAGYNNPSTPDRDISDTDDGEITLDTANYTGFIDLQGRTNDGGATINVFNQAAKTGALNLAAGTSASGGGYTTAHIPPYQLVFNTTYYLLVDAPLYLPTTAVDVLVTDYAHNSPLDTQPLTTLSTVILLGGDGTDDNIIDISDASCIGGSYQDISTCIGGAGADADVNGDGAIDILDLTLMGGNFSLTSSTWTP